VMSGSDVAEQVNLGMDIGVGGCSVSSVPSLSNAANTTGGAVHTCAACEEGEWCVDGDVHSCPAGSSSAPNMQAIENCTCLAGYTAGSDGVECTVCVDGTYKLATGASACLDCTSGSWCTGGIKNSCNANSNSSTSSSAATDCICDVGYTGSDGGTCALCAAGTYKPNAGSASCTTCPEDSFCPGDGSITPCNAYEISPTGSSSQSQCTCIDGRYANAGTCDLCAAGSFCAGGMSSVCPANADSSGGSVYDTDCTCIGGYYTTA
jgi:hypothetical protein